MRAEIIPGAVFPNYELSDHRGKHRPTVEELRLDLRAVLRRCRPDWDISRVEQRTAWAKGEKANFFPYGKAQAQLLAEQD